MQTLFNEFPQYLVYLSLFFSYWNGSATLFPSFHDPDLFVQISLVISNILDPQTFDILWIYLFLYNLNLLFLSQRMINSRLKSLSHDFYAYTNPHNSVVLSVRIRCTHSKYIWSVLTYYWQKNRMSITKHGHCSTPDFRTFPKMPCIQQTSFWNGKTLQIQYLLHKYSHILLPLVTIYVCLHEERNMLCF